MRDVERSIDRQASLPIYRQLKEIIKEKIGDGKFRPGDRIPTERALRLGQNAFFALLPTPFSMIFVAPSILDKVHKACYVWHNKFYLSFSSRR